MPKTYSSNHIIKILLKNNFEYISQRGSHVKYRKTIKEGASSTVIIPANKKEIPYGTFRAICTQSHLDESEFKKK